MSLENDVGDGKERLRASMSHDFYLIGSEEPLIRAYSAQAIGQEEPQQDQYNGVQKITRTALPYYDPDRTPIDYVPEN